MAAPEPISVLFVCLGNICRSTMAEGVFKSLVFKPPYRSLINVVDSCGTAGYHSGNSPDERTMSTLKSHGVDDYRHAARQLRAGDFGKFDYIFCMDRENLRNAERINKSGTGKAKVMLFGEYAGKRHAEIVEDPYYGGQNGFELAYEQCVRFSENFLKEVFPDVKA